ncbi:uncharacterized protein LOC128421670 isoform X3 [Podarcis raffonei]|uniref:uncharacterized protein LOC128421670 isoform X3 n=1 Tax=Podarcis raffonei TaxID=65483 RepID=UPI0023298F89|nr:uncharacterized protein LOC128421670 isoform X3 [Podarcis raffonei]
MGGEVSRKRLSEFSAEAAHASDEEQRRWGSGVDPIAENPSPALDRSTWTNPGRGDSTMMNNPANVSVDEPVQKLAGRKEGQRDLLFDGFSEVLIGDPPLVVAKSVAPQTEERFEWSSLDGWLRPRTQDGMQSLSKGTQTEATCTDNEDRHYFQPRRDCETVYMLKVAESAEKTIQQGLRELFGVLKILVNVPIIFTVELIHFLNKSIFQVLVVDLLTTMGDQMLEPFLVALFNSILQPLLKFLLNVLCSIRDLSYPLLDILKGICLQAALVLRAFRLVEINHHQNKLLAEKV